MNLTANHGLQPLPMIMGKNEYVKTVFLTELLADHLPHLPWFLRSLQCSLENSTTVLDTVCAALEEHPTVYAHFARIAAMAESTPPITASVDQYVVLLGKQRVWTAAVAAYLVYELTSRWSSEPRKKLGGIGILRGQQSLARAHAQEDAAPEQAYVAGILSIIGMLPLVDSSGTRDDAPEWLDVTKEAVQRQRDVFGTDFLELDRWIRLLWHLPMERPSAGVTSVPAPALRSEAILPKGRRSPSAAPVQEPGCRNLILIPKGVV